MWVNGIKKKKSLYLWVDWSYTGKKEKENLRFRIKLEAGMGQQRTSPLSTRNKEEQASQGHSGTATD